MSKYKHKGWFWIENKFIREDARNLSVYAQSTYMVLACHANKLGISKIGYRKISEDLHINKSTVLKAIKELEVYGRIVRLSTGRGQVSHIKLNTVLTPCTQPYHRLVQKETNKENYKGRDNMFGALKTSNPKAFKKLYGH